MLTTATQLDWKDQTPMARCLKRVNVIIAGIKHATVTLRDDPVNHIKNCKCGKGVTRNGVCSQCVMDELKAKEGLV